MTLSDLDQFYLKRSVNPVHYVYIFHSMVSIHMAYLPGAFNYYDSILCVGPHHKKEILKYEKLYKLPPKKLVKAGYYRLERIYTQYQKYLAKKPFNIEKSTILIAPSWGKENVLESYGEDLVDLLLKNKYKVIVRPHPETVRRFPELIDKLADRFNYHSDFTLEKSVFSDESLLKSDVLICDCSGVALEYAFGTERPVLFLDVPYKIRNKNFKELGIEPLELSLRAKIGILISPKKLNTLPQVIENLKTNKIKYKKRLAKLRKKHVYSFGQSSKIGLKYLIKYL